jgi:hypothetical protein
MRQIFVDSRDRISGTSTDFAIQLPETLVVEGGNHKGRIDNLRVPLVIPTIQAGVNDTIVAQLGQSTHTATIPQANYDGPGLAAALQLALAQNTPANWSCTYDISNIAMTLTCTSTNFTITGGTFAAQVMSHPYTQLANQYTFQYVSVLGIDMMYLSSSKFSTLDCIGPGGAHDTLMCAVVTQEYGSVLDVNMPNDAWFDIPALTTQQLDFQLRDRSYNVLSIVPNISFVLLID